MIDAAACYLCAGMPTGEAIMRNGLGTATAVIAVLIGPTVHAAPLLSAGVTGMAAHQPFSMDRTAARGQLTASVSKSGTTAAARVQFGKLTLDLGTTQPQSSVRAQASWSDTITVTAPGVTFGTMYVPILIQISARDQSKTGAGQTSAGQTFTFGDSASGRATTSTWSVSLAARSLYTSISSGLEPLAFTPGVAETVSQTMFCVTSAGTCKVLRAGWGGIARVTDAFGATITKYTIQSASGTNYLTDFVPAPATAAPHSATIAVPEGGANAWFLAGFALLAMILRRRP